MLDAADKASLRARGTTDLVRADWRAAARHEGAPKPSEDYFDSIAVILYEIVMATLTIRNLPDDVPDKLRLRAASTGRSTEAEMRSLLTEAVAHDRDPAERWADWERAISEAQGAVVSLRNSDVSIVDELIADRRREVSGEDERPNQNGGTRRAGSINPRSWRVSHPGGSAR